MNAPKRNRARMLTPDGLKKLRERLRSHELEANSGYKYTLERLGELTGLDPETVKNVLDCKGSDKRTIARCFESFGLTLENSDHIPTTQATAAIADPNFVGREGAIADLDTLVNRNTRVIVIQARGGVGKTTLARKYLQQEFGSFLEFPIAKETKDIASIEGLIEEKLRQLGEEPGREFLVSLDRLKRKLQNERIGILIDNLEPALDAAGKFIEAHRRYVEMLRVLSDPTVKSITLITSRERLREAAVTVQHYSLRSLDVQAWEQFFQSRGINTETPALAALHNAYGGNAKAMDIISGAVLEDFSGDVEAYWQANQDDLFIERDLEDLVTKQFDRLQELDPDAYKLLCRMGCYRYQDVPTVPIEGLFCLLWDVPENRHRRVIKSLQDRSLVDFKDGKFWLHPVIRSEAISRLRESENWKTTNYRVAEFLTHYICTVEDLNDALIALEAYYHYIDISEFDLACDILSKERNNKWEAGESLGRAFGRLGLIRQVICLIKPALSYINPNYSLCSLYNILGDLHWMLGDTSEAIRCHTESRYIAFKLDIEDFKLAYLVNLGLCKISSWELEEATQFFEESYFSSNGSELRFYRLDSLSCLAFLSSCSNDRLEIPYYFVREAEKELLVTDGLSIWSIGYSLVFLGLTYKNIGNINKSFESYQKAMSFAEATHYTQVKTKALNGFAELYRMQGNFETSLSYHMQAIELISTIGAKCDLAEACFQLGLTYQAMGKIKESNTNFQEAIRLFAEMETPKQVERVRQSMQNPK